MLCRRWMCSYSGCMRNPRPCSSMSDVLCDRCTDFLEAVIEQRGSHFCQCVYPVMPDMSLLSNFVSSPSHKGETPSDRTILPLSFGKSTVSWSASFPAAGDALTKSVSYRAPGWESRRCG